MKFLSDLEYEKLLKGEDKTVENELRQKVADLEKSKSDLEKDQAILLKRKDLECENAVVVATAEKIKLIAQLELEKGNLTQKVEMYEKAFENLGFDVKDMKDILNKLVDGIVSKNTIQLVK